MIVKLYCIENILHNIILMFLKYYLINLISNKKFGDWEYLFNVIEPSFFLLWRKKKSSVFLLFFLYILIWPRFLHRLVFCSLLVNHT
jgi:hypothetical protein